MKRPKEVKAVKVGWTLPEDLVKHLRHLAVERGVRVTTLIREALERYVKEQRKS